MIAISNANPLLSVVSELLNVLDPSLVAAWLVWTAVIMTYFVGHLCASYWWRNNASHAVAVLWRGLLGNSHRRHNSWDPNWGRTAQENGSSASSRIGGRRCRCCFIWQSGRYHEWRFSKWMWRFSSMLGLIMPSFACAQSSRQSLTHHVYVVYACGYCTVFYSYVISGFQNSVLYLSVGKSMAC